MNDLNMLLSCFRENMPGEGLSIPFFVFSISALSPGNLPGPFSRQRKGSYIYSMFFMSQMAPRLSTADFLLEGISVAISRSAPICMLGVRDAAKFFIPSRKSGLHSSCLCTRSKFASRSLLPLHGLMDTFPTLAPFINQSRGLNLKPSYGLNLT